MKLDVGEMRLLLHIADGLMLVICWLKFSLKRLEELVHFPSPLYFGFVYGAYHSIAVFTVSTIIYFWEYIYLG